MLDCTNYELFTKGMESQLIIYLFVIVQKPPPVTERHGAIRVGDFILFHEWLNITLYEVKMRTSCDVRSNAMLRRRWYPSKGERLYFRIYIQRQAYEGLRDGTVAERSEFSQEVGGIF